MDFVMKIRNTIFAIECKSSFSPSLSKGSYNAIEDIAPIHTFIVCPMDIGWQLKQGIEIVSSGELEDKIKH